MTFDKQLAIEAFCVGIGNIMMFKIVKKLFPNNVNLQLFASGVLFHLTAEYSGLNDYYVQYKTRTEDGEIIIDTNRIKPCLPSISSTPEFSSSYSAVEYLATTTSTFAPYRTIL